jgi:hypothetical protein
LLLSIPLSAAEETSHLEFDVSKGMPPGCIVLKK